MSASQLSFVTRALRQLDRAFWCLHDRLPDLMGLGLPTLLALIVETTTLAFIIRTWDLDPFGLMILWGIIVPVLGLATVTFLPLPCAVYVWFQAKGEPKSPGDCLRFCGQRASRLVPVILRLMLAYAIWFLFFGLPMLVFWARGCLAPQVALFEDSRQVFARSRKLLKEESAIHILGGLFLLIALTLGVLIAFPRLLLMSEIFQNEWTAFLMEWVWVFEATFLVLLLTILAVIWTVSLTLIYHDIRFHREGEEIRKNVQLLIEKYASQSGFSK